MMSPPTHLLPLLALAAVLTPSLTLALNNASMRPRSVYQLVTDRFSTATSSDPVCNAANRVYCGGTWAGVVSKLDYIQGMGFDTVWISPVVENIGGTTGDGQSYHGYWTLNPEELNGAFGTASDLKALSAALHARGMYLMLDVVVNHVAATSAATFEPDSNYGPFASLTDYHPFCWITDNNNQSNVENCWLGDSSVALPDLDTNSTSVQSYWNGWIQEMIANYSVDALRIDTVRNVQMDFWPGFVSAAGVYAVGEVLDGDAAYVAGYQSQGTVSPFNYPAFFPLVKAFNSTSGDLSALVDMGSTVQSAFADPTLLGAFTNNADNPRFESYTSDVALRANAHAFSLVGDGVPFVYYGSEQGFSGADDPYNREALWTSGYDTNSTMYQFFRRLNAARSAAGNTSASFYTTQANITLLGNSEMLVVKAPLVSILSNRGAGSSSSNYTLAGSQTGWAPGASVIDAVSCSTYTTDSTGSLSVGVESGMPVVLLPAAGKGTLCTAQAAVKVDNTSGVRRSAGLSQVLLAAAVLLALSHLF